MASGIGIGRSSAGVVTLVSLSWPGRGPSKLRHASASFHARCGTRAQPNQVQPHVWMEPDERTDPPPCPSRQPLGRHTQQNAHDPERGSWSNKAASSQTCTILARLPSFRPVHVWHTTRSSRIMQNHARRLVASSTKLSQSMEGDEPHATCEPHQCSAPTLHVIGLFWPETVRWAPSTWHESSANSTLPAV